MAIFKNSLFSSKIRQLYQDGKDKLHVVSDFDGTLTPEYDETGKRLPSNFALIRESGLLEPGYASKAKALFEYYHPFEVDPNLDLALKKDYMKTWWDSHLNLIIESGITADILMQISQKQSKVFRPKVDNFFEKLETLNVPLLIFSAGVGNIIDILLAENNIHKNSNVHTISNYFEFSNGVVSVNKQIIHTFNKDETVLDGLTYMERIENRPNVLVLGNSLGDLGMSAGMNTGTILSIGFLDKPNIENGELEKFQEAYDLVVTQSGDFTEVLEILNGF
jgi:5'-nucleotidase